MSWYWLSYADDDGFRGVVIVEAEDFLSAAMQATLLGVNPGGQVAGWEILEEAYLPEDCTNRLLTKADVERVFGSAESLGDQAGAA